MRANPQGRFVNLQPLLDKVKQEYFSEYSDRWEFSHCEIGWGKQHHKLPRRISRFGSIRIGEFPMWSTILMNSFLDHPAYPVQELEATIYHELCHLVEPPQNFEFRRKIHHGGFKKLLNEHPYMNQHEKWARVGFHQWASFYIFPGQWSMPDPG